MPMLVRKADLILDATIRDTGEDIYGYYKYIRLSMGYFYYSKNEEADVLKILIDRGYIS